MLRSRSSRALAALVVVVGCCAAAPAFAGEDLSDERLATILMRVLAFDRKLGERAAPALTIAVVRRSDPGAHAAIQPLLSAFRGLGALTVQGMTMQVVELVRTVARSVYE